MVHTRSSTKEEIKTALFQLPQRRRRSSAASFSGQTPNLTGVSTSSATKQAKAKRPINRFRCVSKTCSGSRCRFKVAEKGGLCGVHSLPSKLVDEKCPICLDHFTERKNVERSACGHYFHKGCIKEWLKRHHTCPVCRHELREKPEPQFPEGANPVHLLLLPLMTSYFNMSQQGGASRIMAASVPGEQATIQFHIFLLLKFRSLVPCNISFDGAFDLSPYPPVHFAHQHTMQVENVSK